MPKVNSYTPAWLSKPNPGYEIFTPTASTSQSWIPGEKKNVLKPGPRRAIARRGTSEFFVAVGKEIRWADLVYMKEVWEDKQDRQKHPRRRRESATQYEAEQAQGYRV
jgi:nucleoporin NUP82